MAPGNVGMCSCPRRQPLIFLTVATGSRTWTGIAGGEMAVRMIISIIVLLEVTTKNFAANSPNELFFDPSWFLAEITSQKAVATPSPS